MSNELIAAMQACHDTTMNFLGGSAQGHPDFATIQGYLAQAQQNPEQAANLLMQVQQLQNQILATNPQKAVAAIMLSAFQAQEMTATNPVTQAQETTKLPITGVQFNIGDHNGEQSVHIVLDIPHSQEGNYEKIVPMVQNVLAEKFPALTELQAGDRGSWHADTNYTMKYAVPDQIASPTGGEPLKFPEGDKVSTLETALLQGKRVSQLLEEKQQAMAAAEQPMPANIEPQPASSFTAQLPSPAATRAEAVEERRELAAAAAAGRGAA